MTSELVKRLREQAAWVMPPLPSEVSRAMRDAADLIDRLPTTRDGVPVTPCQAVWTVHNGDHLELSQPERVEAELLGVRGMHGGVVGIFRCGGFRFNTADCYSTREAAASARGGEGAKG